MCKVGAISPGFGCHGEQKDSFSILMLELDFFKIMGDPKIHDILTFSWIPRKHEKRREIKKNVFRNFSIFHGVYLLLGQKCLKG